MGSGEPSRLLASLQRPGESRRAWLWPCSHGGAKSSAERQLPCWRRSNRESAFSELNLVLLVVIGSFLHFFHYKMYSTYPDMEYVEEYIPHGLYRKILKINFIIAIQLH